jgi:hypothetical protein
VGALPLVVDADPTGRNVDRQEILALRDGMDAKLDRMLACFDALPLRREPAPPPQPSPAEAGEGVDRPSNG